MERDNLDAKTFLADLKTLAQPFFRINPLKNPGPFTPHNPQQFHAPAKIEVLPRQLLPHRQRTSYHHPTHRTAYRTISTAGSFSRGKSPSVTPDN